MEKKAGRASKPSKPAKTDRGKKSAAKPTDDQGPYLAGLFDHISDAIISTDNKFNILSWNAAAEAIYGWKAGEVIGHRVDAFLKTDYMGRSSQETARQQIFKDGRWKGEVLQFHKDGRPLSIMSSVSIIKDTAGEIIGAVAINRDITEQWNMQEKLAASENYFRALIENSSDGIALIDAEGNITYASPAITRILGYEVDEYVGHSAFNFIHPQDLSVTENLMSRLLEKPEASVLAQIRERHKDGSWRWLEGHAVNLLNDPNVRAIVANFRDITERRELEETVWASERRFRALIENGLDNISLLDANGLLLWESPATVRTLGYPPGTFVGQNILELIHPEDIGWIRDELAGLIKASRSARFGTFRIKHLDGSWRWVDAIATNLLDEPGVGAIVVNYREITKRKQAEQDLRASEERYRGLFNNMNEGVSINQAIYDENGDLVDYIILEVNAAFEKHSPYKPQDVIGRKATDVYQMTPEYLRDWWGRTLQKQSTTVDEYYHEPKDAWFVISNARMDRDRFASIFTNVTERKQAESALRTREEQYRMLFESNPHPMWVFEMDTLGFLAVNEAAVSHYGYTRDEFLAMTIRDIRPVEELHKLEENLRIQAANQQRSGPWVHQTRNGTLIHVEIVSHDITFLGRPARLVLANDITERRRAEQELLESEERFRELADNIEEVFWITEPESKKDIYISPAGENVWGRVVENIDQFMESILAEDRPNVLAALEKQKYGQKTGIEYRIQHLDGSIRWIWDRAFPVFDKGGRLIRVVGIAADITERKQIQEALREREEKLQKLFTILPVGVSIVDNQRNVTESNPALEKILQLSKESLLSGEFAAHQKYVHADNAPMHIDELPSARALKEQKPILDMEIGVIRDGGPTRWTQVSATPLPDVGAVVVTVDISERKQAEKAIQHHASELERRVKERTADLMRANRAKDEFLANMSHEFRTPLNGIMGFSEALMDGVRGPLTDRQKEAVETIITSGRHLLTLINDLLDVSMIEAGKLDFHPRVVDVNETCRSSLAFVRQMALKKSIDLDFDEIQPAISFYADAQRMTQVLVNLLTNSIKFTPEHGRVMLDVKADADKGHISFRVTDTGIGIASEDLERLFNPFVQVDSSLTRQYDGSGLGLALVQKLVNMHGGQVHVESEIGRGSSFTVTLPWSQTMDRDQKSSLAASTNNEKTTGSQVASTSEVPLQQQGTILLAEDKETNVMVVKDYLEYRGYQVVIAHNGLEAIAKAREISPDAILMDVQMPEMDGLEAIRRLRADDRFASTPIIAITAFAMPGDREKCLAAGANEYLSKPISLKVLKQMIERFM